MSDAIAKPAGDACLTCPGRDAPCVRPEPAARALRLAVVGEAPGLNEVREGRPFIGASGRMLERGLRSIGLARANVHWTNSVLCDVKPTDLPAARKACKKRLKEELGRVAAPVTVPVGAWGLQSALELKKKPQIMKWRGSVSVIGDRYVMPTLHPAFAMRSPLWGRWLELDIARVGRVLESGWVPPELRPGHRFAVLKTREDLESLNSLGRVIGGDVETVGLGPVTTRLVCMGFSDGKQTLIVPWSTAADGFFGWWGGGQLEVAAQLTRFLASRVVVSHNGPAFDHLVWSQHGIHVVQWEDTMVLYNVLDGHMPKRLDHVASTYLDVGPWKTWESRKSTLDELWVYNGRDTLYTILAYWAMKESR
jgi:uracil-DNA glycosylase family 4